MNSSYVFLIGSMVCLGISTLFFEKSTHTIGALNTTLWYYILGTLFAVTFYFFSKKTPISDVNNLKWVFLVTFFLFSSVYLFTLSLQKIDVSIAATIRALSFVVTILISFYFSHNAINFKQVIGILLGIGAIVCLK